MWTLINPVRSDGSGDYSHEVILLMRRALPYSKRRREALVSLVIDELLLMPIWIYDCANAVIARLGAGPFRAFFAGVELTSLKTRVKTEKIGYRLAKGANSIHTVNTHEYRHFYTLFTTE